VSNNIVTEIRISRKPKAGVPNIITDSEDEVKSITAVKNRPIMKMAFNIEEKISFLLISEGSSI